MHVKSLTFVVSGLVAVAAGAVLVSAQGRGGNQAPDPAEQMVRSLVGRLSLDDYKATIKGLTAFGDRREGTQRNRDAVEVLLRAPDHLRSEEGAAFAQVLAPGLGEAPLIADQLDPAGKLLRFACAQLPLMSRDVPRPQARDRRGKLGEDARGREGEIDALLDPGNGMQRYDCEHRPQQEPEDAGIRAHAVTSNPIQPRRRGGRGDSF